MTSPLDADARRPAGTSATVRPRTLSDAALAALPDRELIQAVGPRLMQRVSAGTDVTEPQRLVHAAVLLHSGICNGGFEHCFRSPTWKLVPTALEAMTTLGLTAPATVVVQARELFQRKYSDGPPPGRGGRDRDFTMLDMDYFRCFPRGEHLFESRVTAHIRAHIEQF